MTYIGKPASQEKENIIVSKILKSPMIRIKTNCAEVVNKRKIITFTNTHINFTSDYLLL